MRSLGQQGEDIARSYLEKKGYQLITANWSCRAGELDLIMHDPFEATRVIVEVRLRRPTTYGQGQDTVATQKQQKIIRATRWYQQEQDYWDDLRFDVVSIEYHNGQAKITHIPHAFEACYKDY